MNASTIVARSKGLWRHIEHNLLPEASWHLEDLKADAKALSAALAVRFSKDPKVLLENEEHWFDMSADSHVSHCAEDAAADHRRSEWVITAVSKRCKVLAARWGLNQLSVGVGPDGPAFISSDKEFCSPDIKQPTTWGYVPHKKLEAAVVAGRKEATAKVVAAATKLGKSLGVVVGMFVAFIALVCLIYLGGWLGGLAALFALGTLLEWLV